MNTTPTKQSDIKRTWHIIDVKGKILGRSAVEIAHLLIGKSKPYFVRNMDIGDHVVVLNAKEIVVTGKKAQQKTYYRHSGYPGGFKAETFEKLIIRRPGEVIIHAVKGMLPQNKLRDSMLKRLHVYADEKHDHENKFKKLTANS